MAKNTKRRKPNRAVRFPPTKWDIKELRGLLNLLIGERYGPTPEKRLDEIRADKTSWAHIVARGLRLRRDDVVLDLGSGCGFVAAPIAPMVKHVHACDISQAFLKLAQRECAHLSNVSFHRILSMDLSPLPDATIDAAYVTGVFIHLNLYDIYWYFEELARVIRRRGRIWFELADCDGFDPRKAPYFQEMAGHYKRNPRCLDTLMQWNSASAVLSVARHHGFTFKSMYPGVAVKYYVLVRR